MSYPAATVTWTLTYGLVNVVTLAVSHWRIFRSRGEALSWSCTIVDRSGDLAEDGAIGQYLEPFERAANVFQSWLQCVITVGPDTYTSPQLVIMDVNWSFSPDSLLVELSGTDPTELLMAESQTMPDVRLAGSNATLAAILSNYGLSSISTAGLTNYVIPMLHRVGQPLSWVRDILEAYQGWWWWNVGTMTFENGGYDVPSMGVSFTLTDREHLKLLRSSKSASGIYNEATAERLTEQVSGTTSQAGVGLGEITLPLTTQLNEATLNVTIYGVGFVNNRRWKDEFNNTLNPSDLRTYRGTTKAASVVFDLNPGNLDLSDRNYLAEVVGSSVDEIEIGPYEQDYTATYADAADQAIRGPLPFPEPLTNPLIPTQAVALAAATAKVRETLLGYATAAVEVLLNPTHQPGQCAAITAGKIGWTARKYLVESVDWSGDGRQLLETLELSRGAA